MKKILFENGQKVSEAKVTIDEVDYAVTPAVWQGNTPISAYNLNRLQDNLEDEINTVVETQEVEETEITDAADVNGKIDVSGNTIQETIEGEEGTTVEGESIEVTDVDNTKVEILDVSGNSTQETRSGKNLAKILDGSYTFGSVPFTVEKGIIKATGTISGNYTFSSFQTQSKGAIFSVEVTGYTDFAGNNSVIILQQSDDNTNFTTKSEISLASTATAKEKNVTLDSSKYYRIRWYCGGNVFTNATIKVQLEYGTEKTSFEQYGVSPSPDYPSEIHNVGDNVNLYNGSQNRNITSQTVITDINITEINNLTFSADFTNNTNIGGAVYFDDGAGNRIITLNILNDQKIELSANTSNYTRVRVVVSGNSSGYNFDFNNIKLEEGTQATPYSPYNCGNTNIEVSNANIFNKETMAFTRRVMQDDESVINTSNPYVATSGRISLKAGTYSVYAKDLVSWSAYIQVYKNGTRVYQEPIGGNAKGHVFTLDDDYDVHLQLNSVAGSGVNIDSYLPTINDRAILLKGNIITEPDYIEHQSQLITFPFTEGQRMYLGDYLASDGIHHVRKQVVFDGSSDEGWETGNSTGGNYSFLRSDTSVAFNTTNSIIVISNYFKGNTPSDIIDNGMIGICSRRGTGQGIYIRVPNSVATTVSEFKTWLSNNPVTIEYKLAEEVIEAYTTEQQEAYNQLTKTLELYEGINYVYSIDETSPKLKLTYNKVYASPSPDDPSEIHNVGENVNLLPYPYSETTKTRNGITYTDNGDGSITINGTATSQSYFDFYVVSTNTMLLTDRSKTYSILKGITNNNLEIRALEWYSGSWHVASYSSSNYGTLYNINENAVGQIFRVVISSGVTINNITIYPMIVEGNYTTIAYPYSPYNCSNVNIKVSNKNLLDIINLTSSTKNGVTLTKNNDGTIILNGTVSGGDANFDFAIPNIVATSSYKLQIYHISGSFTNNYVSSYIATNSTFSTYKLSTTPSDIGNSNTSLNATTYTYMRIKVSNGVICNNLVIGIQVVADATSIYTPHQSQLITFPLAENQRLYLGDYLASDGIHHVREQIIYNGGQDENWILGSYPETGTTQFTISKPTNIQALSYCSHFSTSKKVNGMALGSALNFYVSTDTGLTTVSAWKTWLQSNPVTVQYELAEEIIEPYTEEQEEAYYNLQHTLMYKDYTKIECIDEIKCKFKVEYYFDNTLNNTYAKRLDEATKAKDDILRLVFPIGSTYITQTDVNPNTILGFGIWERIKGKVLVGLDENDTDFDTIGQTGGEKEHTLTIEEMPSHSHSIGKPVSTNSGSASWLLLDTNKAEYDTQYTQSTGGDQAHNILQPYEVVGYMWIRRS